MPVGDVYKLRIICTQALQTSYNISHWIVDAITGTEATVANIAAQFDTAMAPKLKGLLTGAASYWGVGVQRIRPGAVGVELFDRTSAGVGTAGALAAAKQLCGFFNMKTELAGRTQRGRQYIPFPDSVDVDAALPRPSAGYMVRLGQLAAQYLTLQVAGGGGNTSTLACVVNHRGTGTTDRVRTITAKQVWGTQRRRGDFGRPNPPPF